MVRGLGIEKRFVPLIVAIVLTVSFVGVALAHSVLVSSAAGDTMTYAGDSPMRVDAGAGVSATKYYYTAGTDVTWKALIENHGLRSLMVAVYDVTQKSPVNLLFQKLDLVALGAYPAGTMHSNPVAMLAGCTYKIVPKDPDGAKGSYALVSNEFVPRIEITNVDSTERVYFGVNMGSVGSNVYVLSYLYEFGPVLLYKSADSGKTWGAPVDPLGVTFQYMEPGMCVYKDGDSDTVLVASGGGLIAKSTDGGSIFNRLADLPGYYWRFMAIGTNASWFGTAPDPDIYVVGSTSYSYGNLAITKSHDGGQTWSTPVIIDATGSCPQIVSDGANLYVVYTSPIAYDGALYVSKSSDWGNTWTTGKLLVAKEPITWNIRAYSFQYLDGQKALLTIRDQATSGPADNHGAYGCFNFATMTYVEVARLPQADWMVDEGLAGKLMADGTLMLAWSKYTSGINSQLMFARLSGVVL
jgi:hypothetical protein